MSANSRDEASRNPDYSLFIRVHKISDPEILLTKYQKLVGCGKARTTSIAFLYLTLISNKIFSTDAVRILTTSYINKNKMTKD